MGNIYIGTNGVARKANKIYVGVNGIARQVQKVYVGDSNGIAREVYSVGASAVIKGLWSGDPIGSAPGYGDIYRSYTVNGVTYMPPWYLDATTYSIVDSNGNNLFSVVVQGNSSVGISKTPGINAIAFYMEDQTAVENLKRIGYHNMKVTCTEINHTGSMGSTYFEHVVSVNGQHAINPYYEDVGLNQIVTRSVDVNLDTTTSMWMSFVMGATNDTAQTSISSGGVLELEIKFEFS